MNLPPDRFRRMESAHGAADHEGLQGEAATCDVHYSGS
jgi:hypothetical protein